MDNPERYLALPVTDLGFSVRTSNCFANLHIRTVADLLEYSEAELLRTENFGRKSLNETKEVLGTMGLKLKPQVRDEMEPLAKLLGRYHATKAAHDEALRALKMYVRTMKFPED